VKLKSEIAPNASLSKGDIEEIMKLIIYHKVHYKEKLKKTEQEIRCKLIDKKDVNAYALQVLSDCKKKTKRANESKHVVLMLLDLDQNLYETSIKNIGDENEMEEIIYKEYLRDHSKIDAGKKLLAKGKEIKDVYAKQLNLAAGRFSLSESAKEQMAKDPPDNKIIKEVPRMIAIDYLYKDYKLNDFDIDFIIQNEEDGNL